MSSPRLIVVGSGKLGGFHLQGLAKLTQDCIIDVYDPSLNALQNASTLFNEVEGSDHHMIRFLDNCDDLRSDYDLGINATTSGYRAESVVKTGQRAEHWILEKVLTQNVQQIDEIEEQLSNGQKTWVNLMLRELTWLKDAQAIIINQHVKKFDTQGKNWALACNLPHHLDLVGWLSGGQLQSLDASGLNHEWEESKRRGHYDLLGKITAKYDNGVEAKFASFAEGNERSSTITTEYDCWIIDEIKAEISSKTGAVYSGVFDRQSSLTTRLAENILLGNSLNLPSLAYAANTHRVYISTMLKHWNKTMNRNDNTVPIT